MILNSCKIICNSCSAFIERTTDTTCGYQSNPYFAAKRAAEKEGWVTKQRGGPAIHVCPQCADQKPDWWISERTRLIDQQRATTKH